MLISHHGCFSRVQSLILWTPLALGSSLQAWWDPTTGITLTSSLVSSWTDRKSGLAVTNSTASQRPSLTTINSNQAVNFGSGGQVLSSSSSITMSQPLTIATGFYTNTNGQTPYSRTYNSSGAAFFPRRSDQADLIDFYAGTNVRLSSSSVITNTGYICVSNYNGSSSSNYLDGTFTSGLNPGTLGISGTLYFSSSDNSNESFRGAMLDQVFCNLLTTSQSNKLQGYLAWKWGLQGKLPSAHSYKNRPPYITDP